MDLISGLLLLLSTALAGVKNTLLKGYGGFSIKKREFFGIQAIIFGAGSLALFLVNLFSFDGVSSFTIFLALIYGSMLLCAQWFYTLALSQGKTAICVTIYSFGFIIPTLSGVIFWQESITIFCILGILTIIPVLIISGTGKKQQKEVSSKKYLIPLIIALVCSGGLGIIQKIQQKSSYASQTSTFILIAFLFSFVVSLLFFLFGKAGERKITHKNARSCIIVGLTFSVCNLLNTHLAGALDSAVFFPAINIGSILLSVVLGLIIYKEKLTKRDVIVLALGALAILLVNL